MVSPLREEILRKARETWSKVAKERRDAKPIKIKRPRGRPFKVPVEPIKEPDEPIKEPDEPIKEPDEFVEPIKQKSNKTPRVARKIIIEYEYDEDDIEDDIEDDVEDNEDNEDNDEDNQHVPQQYQPVPQQYQPVPQQYQPVPQQYQQDPRKYQPVHANPFYPPLEPTYNPSIPAVPKQQFNFFPNDKPNFFNYN